MEQISSVNPFFACLFAPGSNIFTAIRDQLQKQLCVDGTHYKQLCVGGMHYNDPVLPSNCSRKTTGFFLFISMLLLYIMGAPRK